MKCQALSVQLNCSCCDAVFLECDLDEHHDGQHAYTREETDEIGHGRDRRTEIVKYRIQWEETERRQPGR